MLNLNCSCNQKSRFYFSHSGRTSKQEKLSIKEVGGIVGEPELLVLIEMLRPVYTTTGIRRIR